MVVPNLLDDLNLTIEARGTTLYQGHLRSKTHAVDVAARSEVIKCIEDYVETSEPVDVECRVQDVRVMRLELRIRLESLRDLLGNLGQYFSVSSTSNCVGAESAAARSQGRTESRSSE